MKFLKIILEITQNYVIIIIILKIYEKIKLLKYIIIENKLLRLVKICNSY